MMNNTLQLTYWTIGGFDGGKPIAQALAETRRIGFEGLELAFGAGELTPQTTEAECKRILQEADRVGFTIQTLACGNFWGMPLSSPDEAKRIQAVDFTRRYLQVAAWLKARTVLVIPGMVDVGWDPSVPVTPYQQVWDRAIQSLRDLEPVARKLGVVIGVENVWNKFLTDPMAMRLFIDQFNSPFVRCYFDVGNVVINGHPEHWIEILGNRIAAVHVKNFKREDAGGVLHGFGDDLLSGDVNWSAVKAALMKIGYTGPITAEMLPFCRLPNMALPDMDLAGKTAAAMKRIFKNG